MNANFPYLWDVLISTVIINPKSRINQNIWNYLSLRGVWFLPVHLFANLIFLWRQFTFVIIWYVKGLRAKIELQTYIVTWWAIPFRPSSELLIHTVDTPGIRINLTIYTQRIIVWQLLVYRTPTILAFRLKYFYFLTGKEKPPVQSNIRCLVDSQPVTFLKLTLNDLSLDQWIVRNCGYLFNINKKSPAPWVWQVPNNMGVTEDH